MIRPVSSLTAAGASTLRGSPPVSSSAPGSFAALLGSRLTAQREVRFSAHALKRIEERGITLTSGDQGRIQDAVDRLSAKGARESLVLMEHVALVVSVPNRTVITAVPMDELNSNVFTQIDSAVVVGTPSAAARPTAPW